jgi:hypothetical protein
MCPVLSHVFPAHIPFCVKFPPPVSLSHESPVVLSHVSYVGSPIAHAAPQSILVGSVWSHVPAARHIPPAVVSFQFTPFAEHPVPLYRLHVPAVLHVPAMHSPLPQSVPFVHVAWHMYVVVLHAFTPQSLFAQQLLLLLPTQLPLHTILSALYVPSLTDESHVDAFAHCVIVP